MTDITMIVEAVVKLIVACLCIVVVPYIKSKCSAEQLSEARAWAKIAVAAAEQLYTSAQGTEKKTYVMNYLTCKGISVDYSDLDKLIEASVLELHSELYGKDKAETNR